MSDYTIQQLEGKVERQEKEIEDLRKQIREWTKWAVARTMEQYEKPTTTKLF
jgi:cell division protein FtsL